MQRALLLLVVVAFIPRAAAAQGEPLGPEFRVNTYTTDRQFAPAVASDSSGNFVVAWQSAFQDGSSYGIFGQRHASSGIPLGPEFRVNTHTTGSQGSIAGSGVAVASDSSGNFVVVWVSDQDGPDYDIFGQRYASSGVPLGPEFRVNTHTTGFDYAPAVASDSAGNFLVVWQGFDGSGSGIFGQVFARSGRPRGREFQLNTYTTSNQSAPAAASNSSGHFVVVWQSQTDSGYGVYGRRCCSSTGVLGPEFRVNTYTTTSQNRPAVTADSSGNFVVVWDGIQDPSTFEIFGQRYDSTGVPLGPEFRVNTDTLGPQTHPSVASDAAGNFVVVWRNLDFQEPDYGVFGQRYDSTGATLGPEFKVNTYTTNFQGVPAVASDAAGKFVVVWQSLHQDGYLEGVFGQRYSAIAPIE